jgi:phosphocarrier protein
MKQTTVRLVNRLGLHARAAAKLVNLTKTFDANVTLRRDQRTIDAKSIMSVLMLAAPVDTDLELTVAGDDEQAAFDAVVALVADRFGEDE